MCAKDCKKFGLAAVVAVVVTNVLEFVVHHKLLAGLYSDSVYASLWNKPEVMKSRMPWMWAAYIIYGVVFTKIYTKGYEEGKAALGQGLRYGFLMGFLAGPFQAMMSYFVYPVGCNLICAWAVAGMVESLILGSVVALVYQPKENH